MRRRSPSILRFLDDWPTLLIVFQQAVIVEVQKLILKTWLVRGDEWVLPESVLCIFIGPCSSTVRDDDVVASLTATSVEDDLGWVSWTPTGGVGHPSGGNGEIFGGGGDRGILSSTLVNDAEELEQLEQRDAEDELELSDKNLILQNFWGKAEAGGLSAFLFWTVVDAVLSPMSLWWGVLMIFGFRRLFFFLFGLCFPFLTLRMFWRRRAFGKGFWEGLRARLASEVEVLSLDFGDVKIRHLPWTCMRTTLPLFWTVRRRWLVLKWGYRLWWLGWCPFPRPCLWCGGGGFCSGRFRRRFSGRLGWCLFSWPGLRWGASCNCFGWFRRRWLVPRWGYWLWWFGWCLFPRLGWGRWGTLFLRWESWPCCCLDRYLSAFLWNNCGWWFNYHRLQPLLALRGSDIDCCLCSFLDR